MRGVTRLKWPVTVMVTVFGAAAVPGVQAVEQVIDTSDGAIVIKEFAASFMARHTTRFVVALHG